MFPVYLEVIFIDVPILHLLVYNFVVKKELTTKDIKDVARDYKVNI